MLSRIISFILVVLLLILISLFVVSCSDDGDIIQLICYLTADPLNKSVEWSEGKDALQTDELKDGKPAHDLSPAGLFYYCALENNCNPVLLLALMENQELLSKPDTSGDPMPRLNNACNYDTASGKYLGFFPQLVASSFQFQYDRQNGLNFGQSYEKNFARKYDLAKFMEIYSRLSNEINQQFGFDYNPNPDTSGSEILDFYHDMTIDQIQNFLESYPNTILKRQKLFSEPYVP